VTKSIFDGIHRCVGEPIKRWGDNVEPITLEELREATARLIAEPPQYRPPLYPPGWTMTECGPLPPGWTVVNGKPKRP